MDTEVSVQKHTGPKDVFTHLLSVVALYVVVFSFGSIIFTLITIAFPDPLQYSYRTPEDALRWPLAVLVIVFPLYLLLQRWLGKDLIANPQKRELRTRKWLLYFTLFVTVIVLIGDLIAVVFGYLDGDLTIPFLLKALTIFLIGASVFLYYGWNLRKDIPAWHDFRMKSFESATVLVVFLTLLWGFWMVGTPGEQRARRFDEERVSNLQLIQSEIVSYWQSKGMLPPTLSALKDSIRGLVPPRDPRTGEEYEYYPTGDLSFELCAVFESTPNPSVKGYQPGAPDSIYETWGYTKGRICFQRVIDPDRYQLSKPKPIIDLVE